MLYYNFQMANIIL